MQRKQAIALSFVAPALMAGCGEMFRAEATRYADAATEVLVDQRICTDRQSCDEKQMVKWEGGRSAVLFWPAAGPFVNLYEVTDAQVVSAIVDRLKAVQHAEALPSVTLTTYAGPHANKGREVQTIVIDARHP